MVNPFKTVLYEKWNDLAIVTLNRPKMINALNVQMRDDLWEILSAVREDEGVRGLLICGAGDQGFCSGADLTEFGSAPSQAIARQVRRMRDLWTLLLALPKPTMAAIHGYCFGSGMEIAALCDLRMGAANSMFAMPEVGLGLVPAAGGTQSLARIMGTPRAMDMVLTGRRIDAEEARNFGFLDWIAPTDNLPRDALSILDSVVMSCRADVFAAAKRAVSEGVEMTLPDALRLERRLAAQLV